MLQWPYCSARKNGTIPQHNSFPSSLSSRTLITTALSHSLLHIYSCVWVPVSVCVSFTSTSVHTHPLHIRKPSYYLIYHLKKGTLAVLWNSNGKIIWWHIPWYLHATPRYFKGMLKQWNLSCKCLNSSFYCCSIWPDSIQPALMFLKGARIRWVWCWAVCVVIIHLFPGWNSIKCYYNNSLILWVRHFHISTAWLCFSKRSRKTESPLSIVA